MFLSELLDRALAPLRLDQKVEVEFAQKKTQEQLYLFLKDRDALISLREKYLTGGEFFKALESTYLSKVLAEVRIRVRVQKCDGALTFRELSEGEQQLLTVLGLLRFTREEEALFLLDEPDTHLNPKWSLKYCELLRQFMGAEQTSQILMTTHDPLTIASLTKEEVRIMTRDEATRKISAEVPAKDPKGMGFAGILTSDLFDLPSDLDPKTQSLLTERTLLAAKDVLSDADRRRLAELNGVLDPLGFNWQSRDEAYQMWLNELSQSGEYRPISDAALSEAERERRKALAQNVIQRMKASRKDQQ